jgi:hypothetical protein
MLRTQNQAREAEGLFRESLDIWIATAGEDHLETAVSRHNLATTLNDQKRYTEAEQLLAKSLETMRMRLGPNHPKVRRVSKAYDETRRLARTSRAAGPDSEGGALP